MNRQRTAPLTDINITPLTDVFLVLLIFFMVTATFVLASQGLEINLPKGGPVAAAPRPPVTLTLQEDGSVWLEGRAVAFGALFDLIHSRMTSRPAEDRLVVIKARGDVLHGDAVAVLDTAKAAGAVRLALAD